MRICRDGRDRAGRPKPNFVLAIPQWMSSTGAKGKGGSESNTSHPHLPDTPNCAAFTKRLSHSVQQNYCADEDTDMKYDLWHSESESSMLLLPEADRRWDPAKASDAEVVGTVEAASYQEALEKQDEFCRHFGLPRTPSGATTRRVLVEYVDGTGQHSIEFPGWGSALPYCGLYFDEINGFELLGQVLIERPLGEMAEEMTVVELRSVDGKQRMFQELSGHIQDKAVIVRLVAQRLCNEFANWRIKEAFLMSR